MNVLVEIDKKGMYPESIVPDTLTLTMTSDDLGDEGIDGAMISQIYSVAKEALSIGADIAAVAGFIYMLIKDYRARVSVNGKAIDSSKSKEEIADVIKKEE